jgi:flagellar basal-body rod protein FlgF
MTDAIALLSVGLRADAEALRVTSQNVANIQTPGYRREVSVLEPAFESLAQGAASASAALVPPTMRVANDWHAGSLQQASGPWNVALEGDGYFVLSTPTGERVTRRGDFTLDATGKLVSHDGFAVLGDGGEITPGAGVPTIDSDGTIHVNGQVIDRLRRVTVDANGLVPSGGSQFAPAPGSSLTEAAANAVKQGFVESSNVAPVNELLRLMETMRHFEMTERFVRGANDMLGNAITTLGKI